MNLIVRKSYNVQVFVVIPTECNVFVHQHRLERYYLRIVVIVLITVLQLLPEIHSHNTIFVTITHLFLQCHGLGVCYHLNHTTL